MDGSELSIIVVVVLNIIVSVFSAGELWQKVSDVCKGLERLEKKVNNTDSHLDMLTERIARIEGKLES